MTKYSIVLGLLLLCTCKTIGFQVISNNVRSSRSASRACATAPWRCLVTEHEETNANVGRPMLQTGAAVKAGEVATPKLLLNRLRYGLAKAAGALRSVARDALSAERENIFDEVFSSTLGSERSSHTRTTSTVNRQEEAEKAAAQAARASQMAMILGVQQQYTRRRLSEINMEIHFHTFNGANAPRKEAPAAAKAPPTTTTEQEAPADPEPEAAAAAAAAYAGGGAAYLEEKLRGIPDVHRQHLTDATQQAKLRGGRGATGPAGQTGGRAQQQRPTGSTQFLRLG